MSESWVLGQVILSRSYEQVNLIYCKPCQWKSDSYHRFGLNRVVNATKRDDCISHLGNSKSCRKSRSIIRIYIRSLSIRNCKPSLLRCIQWRMQIRSNTSITALHLSGCRSPGPYQSKHSVDRQRQSAVVLKKYDPFFRNL
jgi:hypothetical protein